MGAPYAGNAGNFPDEVTILSGSDVPSTTPFNTAYEGTLDRTAWLKARAANAGQNWKKAFGSANIAGASPVYVVGCAAWDPLTSRWLIAFDSDVAAGNAAKAFIGYGLDDDLAEAWTQVGSGNIVSTGGPVVRSLSCDPTTAGKYWAGLFLETGSPNTTCAVYSCATVSSAWSSAVRTWGISGDGALDIKLAVFNGYLIAAVMTGTDGSPNGCVLSSTNNSGSTWSDYFTATGGAAGALWAIEAGPSQVVAAILFDHLSSDQVYTSTDGTTWTAVSLPGIAAADQCAGLAWDAIRGLWVLAMNNTSTLQGYIFTSADGLTWTRGSATPANSVLADIAVLQGNYTCTLADASSSGPSGQIYSVDGGATWYFSQAAFAANISSSDYKYVRSQIARAPIGLCAFNGVRFRFSQLAGLPAAHL